MQVMLSSSSSAVKGGGGGAGRGSRNSGEVVAERRKNAPRPPRHCGSGPGPLIFLWWERLLGRL
jgi:hypothetical protein